MKSRSQINKEIENACIEQIEKIDGFPPDLSKKLEVTAQVDELSKVTNMIYKRKIIVTVDQNGNVTKHEITPPVGHPAEANGVVEPEPVAKPEEDDHVETARKQALKPEVEHVAPLVAEIDKAEVAAANQVAEDFPPANEDTTYVVSCDGKIEEGAASLELAIEKAKLYASGTSGSATIYKPVIHVDAKVTFEVKEL